MSTLRSVLTIPDTVNDPKAIREEVNKILERLQVGALLLGGLKVDTQRVAPTVAPGPFESNVRGATVGGISKLYFFDGSNWVVIGTQT